MKSKPVPLGTTIFKLAFCGLFVAVSGVVSIVAGWLPMWFLSEAVWRRPSLVETRATVSEVELKTRKGSSSSRRLNYSVVARYRFQWQGAEYISTQVTPNVKSSAEQHNTDLFRALKSARESGSAVTAWVDPQDPTYAVLDKSVPWQVLLVALPVAIIFGGVAALFGYLFVLMLRGLRSDSRSR